MNRLILKHIVNGPCVIALSLHTEKFDLLCRIAEVQFLHFVSCPVEDSADRLHAVIRTLWYSGFAIPKNPNGLFPKHADGHIAKENRAARLCWFLKGRFNALSLYGLSVQFQAVEFSTGKIFLTEPFPCPRLASANTSFRF